MLLAISDHWAMAVKLFNQISVKRALSRGVHDVERCSYAERVMGKTWSRIHPTGLRHGRSLSREMRGLCVARAT